MTWDLNGQRLLTGSSDGYIRVSIIRMIEFSDIQFGADRTGEEAD
jgi:hypothetical protein